MTKFIFVSCSLFVCVFGLFINPNFQQFQRSQVSRGPVHAGRQGEARVQVRLQDRIRGEVLRDQSEFMCTNKMTRCTTR